MDHDYYEALDGDSALVFYGDNSWPSSGYWMVPGTYRED